MVARASELAQHRIVLTGATGGLGRAILAEWQRLGGGPALALVRDATRFGAGPAGCQVAPVDFANASQLRQVLKAFQPTAVIHCAATGMQLPRPSWQELLQCNVALSVQLCELTAEIPDCRFVFVSSGLAYREQGRPLREDDPLDTCHPYAASKAAAEGLVRAVAADTRLPLTVIRPFSFSGKGDAGTRLFPSILHAAALAQPAELSSGEQIRDHCAVNDIARGVLLAIARHSPGSNRGDIFNLGSGRTEALRQVIEGVVEELGLDVSLAFGARSPAPFEPQFLAADISHAQQELGWRPEINFAHAVWELARESFPTLKLREPKKHL